MLKQYRNDLLSDWFRSELNSLLNDRFSRVSGTRAASGVFPAVNIYDDGESYLVRAELPGVSSENLDISAKGDQLVIRGERTLADVDEHANFHRREREGGSFRRAVSLPEPIDSSKVRASLEFGILEVYAPRTPESKPRKIDISS